MLFDLRRPVKPQSIDRFSLDHFIDEISSLDRPSSGNFIPSDLNLLGENMVPDFFAGLTNIGPPSIHAFESNDSDCEIIHRNPVVLSAHDFRS